MIMAFKLENVVPWGRNFNEYRLMFQLDDSDMSKKLLDLVMVLPVLIMRHHSKDTLLPHLTPYISFQKKICKNALMMFALPLYSK